MSKVWTPYEYHQADLAYHFSDKPLRTTDLAGNVKVWYGPESGMSKEFPNLSFLFANAPELYEMSKEDPYLKKVLTKTENLLADTIEFYDSGSKVDYKFTDKKTWGAGDWVVQWYLSGLDSSFYYNTVNEDRFTTYLLRWCDGLESFDDAITIIEGLKEKGATVNNTGDLVSVFNGLKNGSEEEIAKIKAFITEHGGAPGEFKNKNGEVVVEKNYKRMLPGDDRPELD